METNSSECIIEIVDQTQISDSELAEFEETQPIKLEDIKEESEEILIRKYISGEASFPTYYTTLHGDEENSEEQSRQTSQNSLEETLDVPTIEIEQDSPLKKRATKRKTGLNPALQGLMGEANLSFVRGKVDIAEKICLEIIRQNPLAPEPFYTMAQIYETRDPEKFLNFSTIAAHLDPSNKDQWIRIAEINVENKNYNQARIHYSKAIKYHPKDYDIRLRKGKLLEMLDEERDAMITYLHMIQHIPENMPEFCLETAKRVAKYYYEQNKMSFALEAMKMAYKNVPIAFSIEDLNLYMQLLIINKNYVQVIFILRDRCNVEMNLIYSENDNEVIVESCIIPDELQADLRVKLCVSLVHANAFEFLPYILTNFRKFISTKDGIDWYMDLIDALMFKQRYLEALEIILFVMEEEENSPALVWLRAAEVYRELKQNEEAIKCYYEVITLAPQCYDAKFTLSALLKQEGRHAEAVKALEQDMKNEILNPRLLYEKCLMLKTFGEIDEYLDVAYILLSRQSLRFRSREELIAWASAGNNFNPETLKTILASRLEESTSEPEYDEAEANLSMEEEYDLFKDASKIAYSREKFGKLEKLCFAMATTKKFKNKFRELEKSIILSCYYNDDHIASFLFFREILVKNLNNNGCWNFMNILIQNGEELRYHRFLKRVLSRGNTPKYLKILLANYHMCATSYKYALDIYASIFKEIHDPLVCLLIGVCFEQISLQKNSLKKATGVAQAVSFMKKYSDLRMCSSTKQEILYNLGRLHHQAGVIYLALHYYQLALEVKDPFVEEHSNILGLEQEIAFNIHLIYKAQGNIDMARKYLYKYCVV
ncbi:general transcription factor 3C polypeptide 3 [Condylostylus longicornis]|uniref:general transcription factor 3C polypeptide 3 n=1 Tax=Condylostylus longicornis TaxID=2530218 RepID=UPI00244E2B24|nr:general transcription factor 3C polypeptide 3 [Condylostylus longicornis]